MRWTHSIRLGGLLACLSASTFSDREFLYYAPFILLFREPAAHSHLELGEGGVGPHLIQQQQQLAKYRHPRFLQVMRVCSLLAHISFDAFDSRLYDLVHQRREVRQHVQAGADVSAQLGALGDRVGEDSPDPGDEEAARDGCEAVGSEEVGGVGGLAIGFRGGDAEDIDLEFITDDQDGTDYGEEGWR
jgi:hypothetical protein